MELQAIIDGEDNSKEIEKIDASTRRTMKIKSFYGADNDEMKYDKDFEMNCILLAPHINQSVKTLTTKEYFNLIKFTNNKAAKSKK